MINNKTKTTRKTKGWNNELWLKKKATAKASGHRGQSRKVNQDVFADTRKVVLSTKRYRVEEQEMEMPDTTTMVAGTRYFFRPFSVRDVEAHYTTKITVVEQDCLDTAAQLKVDGLNPAVLILASATNPGGGVEIGSDAQEEQLFVRSNLLVAMYPFKRSLAERYKLPVNEYQYPMETNFGGIYVPSAFVFRSGVEQGYAYMEKPFSMSFIAVAGIRKGRIHSPLDNWEEEITRNKIRTILRVGLHEGHDSLVLGALACGAFHNDPVQIARLFHEVIDEVEFKDKYRQLTFAILGHPYAAFSREFGE